MTTILSSPSSYKLIVILFLLTLLISCNNKNSATQQSSTATEENIVHIPDDFPEFYTRFHLDPEYQLSHIQFPLAGKSETEKWKIENWEFHKPFTESDEFIRDYENLGGIITERIVDKEGMFYITRRYAKIASEWNLIFYELGTNLDGFVPEQ